MSHHFEQSPSPVAFHWLGQFVTFTHAQRRAGHHKPVKLTDQQFDLAMTCHRHIAQAEEADFAWSDRVAQIDVLTSSADDIMKAADTAPTSEMRSYFYGVQEARAALAH